jgi:hypothetical protein
MYATVAHKKRPALSVLGGGKYYSEQAQLSLHQHRNEGVSTSTNSVYTPDRHDGYSESLYVKAWSLYATTWPRSASRVCVRRASVRVQRYPERLSDVCIDCTWKG